VRAFLASSGVGRYRARDAKFTDDGWWCGSEISVDLGGPQTVSCVKGDFTNIEFDLQPVG
jgi:hypothetical protein